MAKEYRLDTDKTWHQTLTEIQSCFSKWGITDYKIDHNTTPNRLNARGAVQSENAVTVSFTKGDRKVELPLNTQDSPRSNLRALFLCLEGMRMLDVRGVGDVAATAYRQLAGPQEPIVRDPYEVLQCRPDASLEVIEASYRALSKLRHPDVAKDDGKAMAELNAARVEAKRRLA